MSTERIQATQMRGATDLTGITCENCGKLLVPPGSGRLFVSDDVPEGSELDADPGQWADVCEEDAPEVSSQGWRQVI